MIKSKLLTILFLNIIIISLMINVSAALPKLSTTTNPSLPKLTPSSSSILFSNIKGLDYNGCTGTNKVTNISFVNGDLQIVCASDEIGETGTGDITSVQGDIYITNGADSGDVDLVFNETNLISRGNLFGWNSTYNLTYHGLINNASYLSTYNDTYKNLLNQQCPSGQVVNGTLSNGTFTCITDQVGSGGNASFNQSLTDTLYANIQWGYNQTALAGNNITVSGRTVGLNGTSLKNWLDTLYQTIGSYLLVSDLPLTNRTISHWDNVTNKPTNLDTDSTNDLLVSDLPLHNRTLVNCANITGATSNLCTIASGGNSSFNQSLTDTLYSGIEWDYNQTTATFNQYGIWWYNQTTPAIDYYKSNPAGYYNITTLPASSGDNSSWNQSFANTLYASIIWGYNQTTPAITDINNRFWNRTQSYNITEINNFNASWSTTYNATYNNILNQQCPSGQVVNGTLANGTLVCTTDQTGSGGFSTDQINNNLNQSANVTFASIVLTYNNSDYDQLLFKNQSGATKFGFSSEPTTNYMFGNLELPNTNYIALDSLLPFIDGSIGTSASPFTNLFATNINTTRVCIGTDCRTAWTSSTGDGTGGWTNTSTETNTSLNVNILSNANLTVGISSTSFYTPFRELFITPFVVVGDNEMFRINFNRILIGDWKQENAYPYLDINGTTNQFIFNQGDVHILNNKIINLTGNSFTSGNITTYQKICNATSCYTLQDFLIDTTGTDGTGSWINDTIQTNTSVNVNILTGHNITSNWFKGLFNWTVLTNWLSFDGATLSFNETKLNNTISNLGVNIGFNSTYNATYNGLINNASYLSTYNSTYDAKISFNNTNISYLNNSIQQWTGQQNFTTNITITKALIFDNGTCTFIQRGNNRLGVCG